MKRVQDVVVTLSFLAVIGYLSGFLSLRIFAADKPAPRPETPTPSQVSEVETELATLTPEEVALHEHLAQFGSDYIAPISVPEQIAELGLGSDPIIFLAQNIAGNDYIVSWVNQLVVVEINGTPMEVKVTEDATTGKIYWEATRPIQTADGGRPWRKQGDGRRHVLVVAQGFITTTGEGFLIQIETSHGTMRLETALQVTGEISSSSVQPILAPVSAAKCGCRNADGTGSCSDAQCDKSEGCGTGTKKGTCSWRATNCA